MLLLALAVTGCTAAPAPTQESLPHGLGSNEPSAAIEPTPTLGSPVTAQPSPSVATSVTLDADLLASQLYPYSLRWPADEQRSTWRPASAPWDGVARIDNGNKYTDWIATDDGNLFAFGAPTDDSATELRS